MWLNAINVDLHIWLFWGVESLSKSLLNKNITLCFVLLRKDLISSAKPDLNSDWNCEVKYNSKTKMWRIDATKPYENWINLCQRS